MLLSEKEIAGTVARLANEIQRDYAGKNPLMVGILKGSFVFLADLVRRLEMPLEIDFVRLASYGSGTHSSGEIDLISDLPSRVPERHILLVEDIIDTGLTVSFLIDYLLKKGPASLKLCTLMDKPSCRKVDVKIDYLGFTVPDHFLVGYGLDLGEKYRNLPAIYYLE
jgi:hypoxanthine phosphoribosyltransferase